MINKRELQSLYFACDYNLEIIFTFLDDVIKNNKKALTFAKIHGFSLNLPGVKMLLKKENIFWFVQKNNDIQLKEYKENGTVEKIEKDIFKDMQNYYFENTELFTVWYYINKIFLQNKIEFIFLKRYHTDTITFHMKFNNKK